MTLPKSGSIGDTLTFSVLGLPITVPVVSIRRVDWLGMQLNFFMLVNPDLLADAQMHLATLPQMPPAQRQRVSAGAGAPQRDHH